jgi:hypothetical protein
MESKIKKKVALSPAKLAAKRANALKSTGPRTTGGQRRSAANARVTHGSPTHERGIGFTTANPNPEARSIGFATANPNREAPSIGFATANPNREAPKHRICDSEPKRGSPKHRIYDSEPKPSPAGIFPFKQPRRAAHADVGSIPGRTRSKSLLIECHSIKRHASRQYARYCGQMQKPGN